MKTVYRKDGSAVELSDAEAEQWIKRGLATAPPVVAPAKPASFFSKKTAKESTVNKGD
jgi:3'-phosphoadenosine 5'-phosphosulfate (PAPS) 3'-phosphatase